MDANHTTSATPTVNVRTSTGRTRAYAERNGSKTIVRVWDDVAGHYTVCHSLTAAQERYVIGRTLRSS